MLDATAQNRDADANSLHSRDSSVGEFRFGNPRASSYTVGRSVTSSTKSISRTRASVSPCRRELLREAFSKLSYRVARALTATQFLRARGWGRESGEET